MTRLEEDLRTIKDKMVMTWTSLDYAMERAFTDPTKAKAQLRYDLQHDAGSVIAQFTQAGAFRQYLRENLSHGKYGFLRGAAGGKYWVSKGERFARDEALAEIQTIVPLVKQLLALEKEYHVTERAMSKRNREDQRYPVNQKERGLKHSHRSEAERTFNA